MNFTDLAQVYKSKKHTNQGKHVNQEAKNKNKEQNSTRTPTSSEKKKQQNIRITTLSKIIFNKNQKDKKKTSVTNIKGKNNRSYIFMSSNVGFHRKEI